MPEEAAVMDAAEPVETSTDADISTSDEPTQQVDNAQPEQAAADSSPAEPPSLFENGKPTANLNTALTKLKEIDPALAAEVKHAIWRAQEYQTHFPNGRKEVEALRNTIEELGGDHGIKEMRSEIEGFRNFDQMYTQADPKAIDFMTSDPKGQEAFMRLMPTAFGKFQELHPDGYSAYFGQVMSQDLMAYNVPLAVQRLSDFLGDNPKAQEQWKVVADYINRIRDLGSKQPALPKREQAQAGADPSAALEQREQAITRKEWSDETAREKDRVFQAEWGRLTAGRKLADTQVAAIHELFESRMAKIVTQNHQEKLERYFKAGDREGFMRYAASISANDVPRALKAAFEAVVPARPGPRSPNGPVASSPAKPAAKVPDGFKLVNGPPSAGEVDTRLTNKSMFMAGRAVLKNGSRVSWSK